MGTEIFYFSGTGNSLVVARDIAARLNAQLTPIASLLSVESVSTDADAVGIVFPVHNVVNGGLPAIVSRFAAKLETNPSAYIFAVCTCGGGSGDAIANIAKLIKANGLKLSAGYTVKMPFSCPPFTNSVKQQKLFQNWEQNRAEICTKVEARHESEISSTNALLSFLTHPLAVLMTSMILGNYRKLAQGPQLTFDEAVFHADNSFGWDDKCDGCGICEKVCPVNNIEIVNDRPVWQHHCESCLACLVWCPHKSIYGGLLSGKKERYHHPQVKLAEILKQRE